MLGAGRRGAVCGERLAPCDDPVEDRALVPQRDAELVDALCARAQGSEVGCRLWHDVVKQLKDDPAEGLALDGKVEEGPARGADAHRTDGGAWCRCWGVHSSTGWPTRGSRVGRLWAGDEERVVTKGRDASGVAQVGGDYVSE